MGHDFALKGHLVELCFFWGVVVAIVGPPIKLYDM